MSKPTGLWKDEVMPLSLDEVRIINVALGHMLNAAASFAHPDSGASARELAAYRMAIRIASRLQSRIGFFLEAGEAARPMRPG